MTTHQILDQLCISKHHNQCCHKEQGIQKCGKESGNCTGYISIGSLMNSSVNKSDTDSVKNTRSEALYSCHQWIDLEQCGTKCTHSTDSHCLHETGQAKNSSCDCPACRSKYNGADCNRNYVKSYCQWSNVQVSQWRIRHQKKDSCHKAKNGQL